MLSTTNSRIIWSLVSYALLAGAALAIQLGAGSAFDDLDVKPLDLSETSQGHQAAPQAAGRAMTESTSYTEVLPVRAQDISVPQGQGAIADPIGLAPAHPPSVHNPRPTVRLAFTKNAATNQLVLDSIGDGREPAAFTLSAETDLWALQFRDGTGTEQSLVMPSNTAFSSFTVTPSHGGFQARWIGGVPNGSNLPAGQTFEVAIDAVRSTTEPVIEMTIKVTSSITRWSLEFVDFPRVKLAPRGAAATQILSVPYFGGWLAVDPIASPRFGLGPAGALTHPGEMSMQWLSYYNSAEDDGPLLMLGSRDRAGYNKEYWFDNTSGKLAIVLRQFPEINTTTDKTYSSPYPAMLSVMRGQWYEAARAYRRWALKQPWTARGPMHRNRSFSKLVKNAALAGVSGTTTGPSDYRYWKTEMQYQTQTYGVSNAPDFVFGWHNNPFDANWGNWFPIHPEFEIAGKAIARAGHAHAPYTHVGVYGSHAGVRSYANSYVPGFIGQSVDQFRLISRDGTTPDFWDIYGLPAVHLCYAAKKSGVSFAGNYAKHLARELNHKTGARGIYYDTYTATKSQRCYDSSHEHPIGGGKYYTQRKRQILADVRRTMRRIEPQFFIYSEAQNEAYVGLVELVYSHNTGEVYLEDIRLAPLYNTVYHDHQIVGRVVGINVARSKLQRYGPEALLSLRRTYAADLFMDHTPWAGSELSPDSMASNLAAFPNYAALIGMTKNFVKVLKQPITRRFVHFGPRLRDPVTTSQLIPKQSKDGLLFPYRGEQPQVYASAWGDSKGKGLAILLLNWTSPSDTYEDGTSGSDETIQLTIDPAKYPLRRGRYELHEVSASGDRLIKIVNVNRLFTETITVPERTAKLLYLVRHKSRPKRRTGR